MSSATAPSPGPPAPTPTAERLLTPDLARGVMLLLIALAHSRMLHPGGSAISTLGGGGPLDVAVQFVLTSLVDARAAPLFGLLFGYGLVQMTRRYEDPAAGRRLIRRRGMWLVVFGVAHVVLLYSGDIIGGYGMFALLFAGAVTWPGRRLWVVSVVTLAFGALVFGVLQLLSAPGGLPVAPTLLGSAALRASALPVVPIVAVTMAAPVFVGVWAARRRVLEQPERHRALLRRVALIGLPVAVIGALPVTLKLVGVRTEGTPLAELGGYALFAVTGVAGGLAYAAIIALVAARRGERRGPVTTALVACGRRSMTFYLAQSPVWWVATEPALLDLGGRLGAATAALVGVVTWLVTVLLADLLGRTGRRGPFEALLRRLTYGRSRPLAHRA